MRRPNQILRSLFSHERRQDKKSRRHELDSKALKNEAREHELPAPLAPLPGQKRRSTQMVHATKTHPGVKKARNRAANRRARASRKANRS